MNIRRLDVGKESIFGNKRHAGLSKPNDKPLFDFLDKTIKIFVWILVALLIVATGLIAIVHKL